MFLPQKLAARDRADKDLGFASDTFPEGPHAGDGKIEEESSIGWGKG